MHFLLLFSLLRIPPNHMQRVGRGETTARTCAYCYVLSRGGRPVSQAQSRRRRRPRHATHKPTTDRPTACIIRGGERRSKKLPLFSFLLFPRTPSEYGTREGGREAVGRVEKLLRLECRRRRRPEEKGERVQVTGGGGQATTRSVRLPRLITLLFFLILFSLGIRAFGWW